MAVHQFASVVPICSSVGRLRTVLSTPRSGCGVINTTCRPIQCQADRVTTSSTITRRSANYKPTIWSFDYIQSLTNEYAVN